MAMIKSELFNLWKEKERREGHRITIEEVANATGLAAKTVSGLLNDRTSRYDNDVIAAICEYFDVPDGDPVPFLVVRY